jgi:hypothetical protein
MGLLAWALVPALQSCSPDAAAPNDSALKWIKSRGDQRFAYLEQRDLADSFTLGMSFITAEAINPALQNLNYTTTVRLMKKGARLVVTDQSGNEVVNFALGVRERRYEIDFAAIQNKIQISELAGDNLASEWQQSGAPEVVRLEQTNDSINVDLKYEFTSAASGASGSAVLRIALKRDLAVTRERAPEFDLRTIDEALQNNIGYFTEGRYIKRFNLPADGEQIVFMLENVPAAYQKRMVQAVEEWNVVFGKPVIKAKIAPAGSNLYGDNRYNVIKWADEDVGGFVGRASPVYADRRGQVFSGNVLINGGFAAKFLQRWQQTQDAYQHQVTVGAKIGSTPFSVLPGETPFVPFYTGQGVDRNEALQRLYETTVVHEVGHVLGLRHNFRASAFPDSKTKSSSVMDYGPRGDISIDADHGGIGSWDVAAIRWGYYGEIPQQELQFCTDENMEDDWLCNQADFGNPVEFLNNAAIGAREFLMSYSQPLDREFLNNVKTFVELHAKMERLSVNMPNTAATYFAKQASPSFEELLTISSVDSALSGTGSRQARANLALAQQIAKDHAQCLRQGGMSCR